MIKQLMGILSQQCCASTQKALLLENVSPQELQELSRLAAKHDLAHVVSAAFSGISVPPQLLAKLNKQQMLAVFRYEQQHAVLQHVSALFEESAICFIPLKGSVIRAYYPEPWMRTSCDIDILVGEEDIERATAVLTEAGYRVGEKSSHDLSFFSESGVHIELHFSLFDPDFLTVDALRNVFADAKPLPDQKYHCALSHEMFCFYHIYHMAKHVMAGGCGIKPFLDLFLIRHKMGYDEMALEVLLEKNGLLRFASIAMKLCDVWFGEEEHDNLTLMLEQYVLEGKAYGTEKHTETMRQVKAGGKWKHMSSRVFLSFDRMCKRYPSLSRCPILFPFYQVRRWIEIFFSSRRKKALRELSLNAKISKAEAAEAAGFLSDIGL